ncbi:hypothetical protein [Streptomyces sp. NPDC101455]|uniref:hypothetical protein n=1 Tax=Streptomyces sp. NPDC101455 TaxID=3366142 RepID=UPI00380765F1
MRRSVELQIITEALQKMGPHAPATRIWGRAPGANSDMAAEGNVWAGDVHDIALHIATRLSGRPDTSEPSSPLAQADDAKRARDIFGEIDALKAGHARLTSAPWYPARPGDLVHIAYEAAGDFPAIGETYIVGDAGEPGDAEPHLLSLMLLAHTGRPDDQVQFAGAFAAEAADDPLVEMWMEAGPHRLTIVRDGRPVHIGGAR